MKATNFWAGDTPTTIVPGRPDYLYKDFRRNEFPPGGNRNYYVNVHKMQLPADLTCKHCILQVKIILSSTNDNNYI